MGVRIRKAEESDFKTIITLFKEFATFEKHPEKMVNTEERMLQEQAFFNGLVAEHEGKIIGYAAYFFCYYTWIGKSLYLDDLYITPTFRGQGIGRSLFDQVLAIAKRSGCHRMRWQVSSWNAPAIDFYKKLGAHIDDVEKNCDLVLEE